MSRLRTATLLLLCSLTLPVSAYGEQQSSPPTPNAALRYWSAFSAMQDSSMTDQEAKSLRAVVEDGAAYSDSQFGELVKGNALAIGIMSRGTELPICNWGLDYGLGENLPVEYATRALVLGRLNVLYADHLFATGDIDGGVRALGAGLRFSRDVGNGGPLIATLIAKGLLLAHLKAVTQAIRNGRLSPKQRLALRATMEQIRGGLDWSRSVELDLQAVRTHYAGDPATQSAITNILPVYSEALSNASSMSTLTQALTRMPQQVAREIPNAKRLSEQKQELTEAISEVWALLQ